MQSDRPWKGKDYPAPGAWRDDDSPRSEEPPRALSHPARPLESLPQEQSKLLELLGLINFRILSGHSLYIETGGAVYKILYGCYWRSVFTGAEHYFLRCDRVADGVWIDGNVAPSKVDLAIRYTDAGWLVKGHSLKFMVHGD
ncbi:MAG TPA: hypothetical protein VN256_21230 [Pyrinomonadaceae bacterium]|nr:hypothetical protein [Pyrinomonadaceae bacterium]